MTLTPTRDPARDPARDSVRQAPLRRNPVRRSELAAYLRACRSRITPEAAGLPAGPRRRTPGLRREEVAQLAGVGITWYTWLEQGRRINASEQVIEAIARSLRLDPTERDHLFRLAEVTPAQPRQADWVPPEVHEILTALDPLPATVTTGRYDLLAWNDAYMALFPNAVDPRTRRNTLWCVFTTPECCNPFVNREIELPRMVAMLRATYGRHIGEPDWESFIADLRVAAPTFGPMWDRQQVAAPGSIHKAFRFPSVGEIRMTTTSLSIVSAPETRIVVYTPEDDASRDSVALLRAHPELHQTDHEHEHAR